MREYSPNFWQRIAIDVGGFALLLAAGLFGWIPGPGGIPLLIGGLSLLAINHKWARQWLRKARAGSLIITEKIFIDHPVFKAVIDVIGVGLIILAFWLFHTYSRNLVQSLAVSAGFIGLGLFLGNRKRLTILTAWVKRVIQRPKA